MCNFPLGTILYKIPCIVNRDDIGQIKFIHVSLYIHYLCVTSLVYIQIFRPDKGSIKYRSAHTCALKYQEKT